MRPAGISTRGRDRNRRSRSAVRQRQHRLCPRSASRYLPLHLRRRQPLTALRQRPARRSGRHLVQLAGARTLPRGGADPVPPVRVMNRQPRVLLYAPRLYELGFKQHHVDGEALALSAHLKREGYDCIFLDAYCRAIHTPPLADAIASAGEVDALLVHLWTSDAYGPRLRAIADELAAV